MNGTLTLEDISILFLKTGLRWFLYLLEHCQLYQPERAVLGGG